MRYSIQRLASSNRTVVEQLTVHLEAAGSSQHLSLKGKEIARECMVLASDNADNETVHLLDCHLF
jgi:hypothetical protein